MWLALRETTLIYVIFRRALFHAIEMAHPCSRSDDQRAVTSMSDLLTPERRSWNMSRIRSTGTKPEIAVRSLLHRIGFRFRVNRRDLPGPPDIVLPGYRAAVFVHGCFWHRHRGCKRSTTPATRREFRERKFAENVTRDRTNGRRLRRPGWRVYVVWECCIQHDPVGVAIRIAKVVRGAETYAKYRLPSRREILNAAEKRVRYGLMNKQEA